MGATSRNRPRTSTLRMPLRAGGSSPGTPGGPVATFANWPGDADSPGARITDRPGAIPGDETSGSAGKAGRGGEAGAGPDTRSPRVTVRTPIVVRGGTARDLPLVTVPEFPASPGGFLRPFAATLLIATLVMADGSPLPLAGVLIMALPFALVAGVAGWIAARVRLGVATSSFRAFVEMGGVAVIVAIILAPWIARGSIFVARTPQRVDAAVRLSDP